MTTSSTNQSDLVMKGFLEVTEVERQFLQDKLMLIDDRYMGPLNVQIKHQLLNKLTHMKMEGHTGEAPTQLISDVTNLTEALGQLTEAIQTLGEVQLQRNKIESLKLPTHVEVVSLGVSAKTGE